MAGKHHTYDLATLQRDYGAVYGGGASKRQPAFRPDTTMRNGRRTRGELLTLALTAAISMAAPLCRARMCEPALDADGGSAAGGSVPVTPSLTLPPDMFLDLAGVGQQTVDASQTDSNTGGAAQSASEGKDQTLRVNPVTGLVSATGSGYEPLTGHERWKLYWKMNFLSVGAYFGPFFDALLLDQATGSPAQWGGGFKGYGRRVASRTANAMLQGTLQAPLAAALHEDVRYITSTQHGFKRRAVHAIVYSFLTYNDQGHPTPNIANLSAYYGSTAISTVWLPGHYNWASYALSNSTEQIGLTMPVNLLQEFWPEISRHVLHRH